MVGMVGGLGLWSPGGGGPLGGDGQDRRPETTRCVNNTTCNARTQQASCRTNLRWGAGQPCFCLELEKQAYGVLSGLSSCVSLCGARGLTVVDRYRVQFASDLKMSLAKRAQFTQVVRPRLICKCHSNFDGTSFPYAKRCDRLLELDSTPSFYSHSWMKHS